MPQTDLQRAIFTNNLEEFNRLLESGVDINERGVNGDTALVTALRRNPVNTDMANRLLDAGANVNIANDLGITPLDYAIRNNGSIELIERILGAGANVNNVNANGYTVLDLAVRRNDIDLVRRLLGLGADASQGRVLHTATQRNNTDMVRLLIAHGANPNFPLPAPFEHPLIIAVNNGNAVIVEELLNAGADMAVVDQHWSTPMHIAQYRLQWSLNNPPLRAQYEKIISLLSKEGVAERAWKRRKPAVMTWNGAQNKNDRRARNTRRGRKTSRRKSYRRSH